MVWLAACEDNISLLELSSMQVIASYSYLQVLTFGGCQEDFMLVISTDDGLRSQKLLFALSKPKVSFCASLLVVSVSVSTVSCFEAFIFILIK